MARFLVQRDGLFLGSSSAVNLVACVKLVRKMGWGNNEKVVTVLCVFPYFSDLSHCPDAIDAENLPFGHTRLINSRCDSGARHYSKVRLHFLPFGPGGRVRYSSELMDYVNGYKQKLTLNLTTVLVRSFLRTFFKSLQL